MIGFVPERRVAWIWGLALGQAVFFLFLLVMAMFHRNDVVYGTSLSDLASLHGDQCEHPADKGWLVEAQNTLSNLGYAVAGAMILLRGRSWAATLYGGNLVILAVLSGLYHATLVEQPQILDVVWVYAALLSLAVYGAYVLMRPPKVLGIGWLTWLIVALVWSGAVVLLILVPKHITDGLKAATGLSLLTAFTALAAFLAFVSREVDWLGWVIGLILALAIGLFGSLMRTSLHWDSDYVFAALIVVLILMLVLLFTAYGGPNGAMIWELVLIAVIFGLGLVCRLLDGYNSTDGVVTEKVLCHPDSPFQAHAWWHLLGAAALLCSYDLMAQIGGTKKGFIDDLVMFPAFEPAEKT